MSLINVLFYHLTFIIFFIINTVFKSVNTYFYDLEGPIKIDDFLCFFYKLHYLINMPYTDSFNNFENLLL